MRILRAIAYVIILVGGLGGNAEAQLRSTVYASGFAQPVDFVQDPLDPTVQFIVEQAGRIRAVRAGTVLATDFLDLTAAVSFGGERGLLGLAFAPDAASGRFFVNFTNINGDTVVARFRRSANPLVADPNSRFDLHWGGATGPAFIAQPYANHNGGNLMFGPDGFLYIGMGDGGSGNDPENRAQNPQELLGKMLRIDVNVPDSDPAGYVVPPDNPFVGGVPVAARPEIWSFGLRNPWRYSFDDPARGGTGALVIGDVGQNLYEEIDYEPRGVGGRNYGWRIREGMHNNVTTLPAAYLPLTDPIFEYDHTVGDVITGGFVYRGSALGPSYQGRYFFADEAVGRVWSIALTINPTTGDATASDLAEHTAELGSVGNISSFGIDAVGELYLVSYSAGTIVKILGPPPPGTFVGPLAGGGWTGTISGSNLLYNGASYPIINGRLNFPDCTTFIVAPNGALAGGSTTPNCTQGGVVTPPAPSPPPPPTGGTAFVGPLGGAGWTGTISGTNVIYKGVSYPIVNGRVNFPDCTTFIVAPNGALAGGAPTPNCTPGGVVTPPAPPPTGGAVFVGPMAGGGWTGMISGSSLLYNGVSYAIVNGRVNFPDCTTFIVAPDGALAGGATTPNCTAAK